jgi:prepilin-type N-terminal cleavage/methylation domain-containing protein
VSKGFTLIELLVVTGIIVVITTIVLANDNRFGGVVLLENLAYNIALSIRQAQVYGISVQRFGTGTFNVGYGMHFNLSSPTTYLLFADAVQQNGMYDQGELVASTDISSGYQITKLCAPAGTDAASCTAVPAVDILFERPEPDAWISVAGVSCVLNNASCATDARIVLASPRGDIMSVVVEANGQISVKRN